MLTGLRNAYDQFRIGVFGPESLDVDRNRERNAELERLQRQINEATDFDELSRCRGYVVWRGLVQVMLDDLNRQLRNATAAEFQLVQAKLLACEAAVNLVPDKIAAAHVARERLEELIEEVAGG